MQRLHPKHLSQPEIWMLALEFLYNVVRFERNLRMLRTCFHQ